MRSGDAAWRGGMLMRTPSYRQQAAHRWLTAVCALLALAPASGLAGSPIHPTGAPSNRPGIGPFSCFPSE